MTKNGRTKTTRRRQHQVPRFYLASWSEPSDNEKGMIWTYFKKSGEIKEVNVQNVAVENYTYDISGITENDKLFFDRCLMDWQKEQGIRPHTMKFLENYKEKDFLEKNYIGPIEDRGIEIIANLRKGKFPFDPNNDIWKQHQLLVTAIYEMAGSGQTSVPNLPELEEQARIQYESGNAKNPRWDFFEFLVNQLFRTAKCEKILGEMIGDFKMRHPDETWLNTTEYLFPLMVLLDTQMLAYDACKRCCCIEFIRNVTSIDFITSDCPVVLFSNPIRGKESIEYYYPLDRRHAIRCGPADNNVCTDFGDPKKVDRLNKIMFDYAERQVFAYSKEELERYLRLPTKYE